ncbi:hypothetical protein KJK32_46165 (plasmid) [Streptomyces sp. JCM17656]|nr:hypothetical protein KJK32_46165 [Streptomyces sp. JCM17656]
MKSLTTRSATLATCAALLIVGTTSQAYAEGPGEPSTSIVATKGHSNITVSGNSNNVAGNDLIIGDNNISGTGHTIGSPQTFVAFTVQNATNDPLVLTNVQGTDISGIDVSSSIKPASLRVIKVDTPGTTGGGGIAVLTFSAGTRTLTLTLDASDPDEPVSGCMSNPFMSLICPGSQQTSITVEEGSASTTG